MKRQYQLDEKGRRVNVCRTPGLTCADCGLPIQVNVDRYVWTRQAEGSKHYHVLCADKNGHDNVDNRPIETPFDEQPLDNPYNEPYEPYEPEAHPAKNGKRDSLAERLAREIQEYLPETSVNAEQVRQIVTSEIDKALDKALKNLQVSRMEFKVQDLPVVNVKTPHPLLPQIIETLLEGDIPYLFSAAGAGKTHACKDAARTLGYAPEEVYIITCNSFMSPIELTGYTDLQGKPVDKAFLKAYRDGHFVVLDEADRTRPDFLPALNSALENGVLVAPDGTIVFQHARFMIAMTGNTTMRGKDRQYNSASQQDLSVIDRVFYIRWAYDEKLERDICRGMHANADVWVDWIHAVRRFVSSDATCADLVVSMRACIKGLKRLLRPNSHFTVEQLLEGRVWKGLPDDTRKRILAANPIPSGLSTLCEAA